MQGEPNPRAVPLGSGGNLKEGGIIPIAEPEFTNSCACRIPPLPALSPLDKGGEGRGEGGFESCAFTNFGNAVGIRRH
jgi:hypothetical protein